MRIVGWLLLVIGGLLGLGAVIAVLLFVLFAGLQLLSGGRFTEALGSIMVGGVVVVIALLLGATALFFGIIILNL